MIPVTCRVKHDPENGTYGDCMRACIASLLELDAEAVPHFYEGDCDAHEGMNRVVSFVAPLGYMPFYIAFDGANSLDETLSYMAAANPQSHYLLFGMSSGGGDHVVVCRGGEVVHNPAWFGCSLVGPTQSGNWIIMVLAKS